MHSAHDAEELGLEPGFDRNDVHAAYRARALVMHPDLGGTDEQMTRLNAARDRLLESLEPGAAIADEFWVSHGDVDTDSVLEDRDTVKLRFYLVPLIGFPLFFIFLVALANTIAG